MPVPTPVDQATEGGDVSGGRSPLGDAPVMIEARGLEKTFRIPRHRISSFKERAVHPLARPDCWDLRALRQVSFQVHRGEFFGIVGRNGSGKSTLLKILASIYRPDAGEVLMAGRPAPFIELGVGFDPELTARENVVLNGVMMGLSRREARRRLDAVLEFAELGEFLELRLKNYSSGMMVRLAFAVMIQAEADILLIDEVLAVGDASFQQKCADTFRRLRDEGRTIVLVTHDMSAVEEYCHRAMLIHDGEVRRIGDPEEVSRRYFRLNFGHVEEEDESRFDWSAIDGDVRLIDAWLADGSGERITNVEQGEPIRLRTVVEATQEIRVPAFGIMITNAEGVDIFGFGAPLTNEGQTLEGLAPGERVRIACKVENPLRPGRYFVSCVICRNRNLADVALRARRLIDFVVFGGPRGPGLVTLETEIEALPEPRAGS
jgi:ABC-2 type transport system ATP-binding protein